jgi:hypothetical protein
MEHSVLARGAGMTGWLNVKKKKNQKTGQDIDLHSSKLLAQTGVQT